jgi:solute carrier family 6 amino acid transporter-like protein 5/7/9/14
VDFFGVSLIIYVTSTLEVVAVAWFYGLYNFIDDVEFMLGFKLGYYWKITYGIVIPISLSSVLVYNIVINDISAGFPPSAISKR